MKKEKINIRFAPKVEFDFGMINKESSSGEIKNIDKEWWIRYVNLRADFETMHRELINKVKPKGTILPHLYIEKEFLKKKVIKNENNT